MFLGENRLIIGKDCQLIYESKDYYRKRLKVLEKEKYVRRVNRFYIKLDDKGTKMVKLFGYEYNFGCRNKEYEERKKEIAKIAALSINNPMEFIASWNIKNKDIYTQVSRKFIGELKYCRKSRIVYYISKDKAINYIQNIINDMKKLIDIKDIIIFMENFQYTDNFKNFILGNNSTMIINPTQYNLDIMREIEKTDLYPIVKMIHNNNEILLSNWKKADYMTNDRVYIAVMPFLDIERLFALNMFFKNNQNTNRKIEIITLKENHNKIEKFLDRKVCIIELDEWLGGVNEDM